VLGGDAVHDNEDHPYGDAGHGGDGPQLGQGARQSALDRAGDSHQAAEHNDQPNHDHEVNEHPVLALGDRLGHALRVSARRGRVEEVSDHGQERADDARYGTDPEDLPFFTPGVGRHFPRVLAPHVLLPLLVVEIPVAEPILLAEGVESIRCATSSGSSNCGKCLAVGKRNSSESGNRRWK
jgi:hypothetical protein